MPTTTPVQALPIPILADVANVPLHVQNLAQALETKLVMVFATAAARTAAIPAPTTGMLCWRSDASAYEYYTGSAWVPLAGGAWTSYTPAWTGSGGGSVSYGTGGAIAGSYLQAGKVVHYRISMLLGTSPSGPSGVYQWSLPLNGTQPFGTRSPAGTAHFFGGTSAIGTAFVVTAGIVQVIFHGSTSNAAAQAGNPGTWQSTSQIIISGTYEAA